MLEKGRGADAVIAAQRAAELDQIGIFGALPSAVEAFAQDQQGGAAGEDALTALKDAVGPGPLAGRVENLARPT